MTDHRVRVLGLDGEGVLATCICGGWSCFDMDFDDDFDTLAARVAEHRRRFSHD